MFLSTAVNTSTGYAAPRPEDKATDKATDDKKWNIEKPPGEGYQQKIDVTEGTWLNLDVSPDGTEIVFDLLGDIYSMPITGADGKGDNQPKKLASGTTWDMQPRYSPDGQWIAFTSDRTGKSERGWR